MGPMSPFTIRPSAADEVEAVLRMKNLAWRQTYAGKLSDAVFDRLDAELPAQAVALQDSILQGAQPPRVATDASGHIVGVAAGGPARGDNPPTEVELYMVYVLTEAHGMGVGHQLVSGAIGSAPAFVWVLESNARAIAFYRKLGFTPDGTAEPLSAQWNHQRELRMVRATTP